MNYELKVAIGLLCVWLLLVFLVCADLVSDRFVAPLVYSLVGAAGFLGFYLIQS